MPLRTRVYIDGYNLYYGSLRKTPYKWLDLLKLFEDHLLPAVPYQTSPTEPPVQMVLDQCAIRFFTAPILTRAAKGDDSVQSQIMYHKALEASGRVLITMGYYSLAKSNQHLVDSEDPEKDPNRCGKISVWKLEEKQSDVNLALAMFDDAISCPELDQIVLVTNDTDIAPALALIKKKRPGLVIGLVNPTRPGPVTADGNDGHLEREVNAELRKYADWTRRQILPLELAASQFPRVVRRKNKDAIKPISWYARPDLLEAAMVAAKPITPKPRDFFNWAESESCYLGNKRPIDLLEHDEGAAQVMTYIETYIRDHLPNNAQLD